VESWLATNLPRNRRVRLQTTPVAAVAFRIILIDAIDTLFSLASSGIRILTGPPKATSSNQ
jgi:hypothetical protein